MVGFGCSQCAVEGVRRSVPCRPNPRVNREPRDLSMTRSIAAASGARCSGSARNSYRVRQGSGPSVLRVRSITLSEMCARALSIRSLRLRVRSRYITLDPRCARLDPPSARLASIYTALFLMLFSPRNYPTECAPEKQHAVSVPARTSQEQREHSPGVRARTEPWGGTITERTMAAL